MANRGHYAPVADPDSRFESQPWVRVGSGDLAALVTYDSRLADAAEAADLEVRAPGSRCMTPAPARGIGCTSRREGALMTAGCRVSDVLSFVDP